MTQNKNPIFQYDRRVYYADTDAAGIVYYSNYLYFFEEARAEYLRSLGYNQSEIRREVGVLFLVKNIYAVDYLGVARLDDLLTIDCEITELSQITAKMRQDVRLKDSDELLVTAELRLVCVSSDTLKPTKIPPVIKEKLGF